MNAFTDIGTYSPQTIELDGFTFEARVEHDECMGAPWVEHDGHGIVTDWTSRNKLPCEVVLSSDRSSKRFYDMQSSVALAKRDGWGCSKAMPSNATKGQIAAQAALEDFERLKAWCDDKWYWVYVVVVASFEGHELGRAALGGIESDADSHLLEIANELIQEALEEAKAAAASLGDKLKELTHA
jgi:hypothetical protein